MSTAALHLIDQAARFSRWGRNKAASDAYRQACSAPLDVATRYTALVGLARSLDAQGENEQAINTCDEAIRTAPDLAPAYGILALLLIRENRLDQAAAAATEARLRDPDGPAMPSLVASIALRRGRISDAIGAASTALARDPENQRARALLTIAKVWRDGQTASPDIQQLIRVSSPQTPQDFPSMAAFNSALNEAIRAQDMLERDGGGTLVEGARLHDIFALTPPLAEALRTMFLAEARLYSAALPAAVAPSRLTMRGWANVMEAGAYEKPHIHEGGWLSGCYYPQVPAPGGTGGEIVFGPHDLGPAVPSPANYRISPVAGQIILFPSWLYHSTRPFAGDGVRISVAADIVRGS